MPHNRSPLSANFVQNAMKKDWLPIWRLRSRQKKKSELARVASFLPFVISFFAWPLADEIFICSILRS